MRKWVENWKRVGPELEKIKRQELRKMTDEQAYDIAVSLSYSLADDAWIDPRHLTSSGLVEQQRWFRKAATARK